MKPIHEYTFPEWLRLYPLISWVRELRNDVWLNHYLKRKTSALPEIRRELQKKIDATSSRALLIIVAFEHPWALEFLIEQAAINIGEEFVLFVVDNSRDLQKRHEIHKACTEHGITYLALPYNASKHPNRSHGMAMTYAFVNCIRELDMNYFGFIDHDLIPIKRINLNEHMKEKKFWGLINKGHNQYWSLWAGFCFFKLKTYKNEKLNFLYDFSRGLDTGGRNWDKIYAHENLLQLQLSNSKLSIYQTQAGQMIQVQIIDDSWMHMSGVSYGNNWKQRGDFFENLRKKLQEGKTIEEAIQNIAAINGG